MFAQHFAAVTILFIHALHHPDKTNEFKQEVRPSYEVFSQAAMSDQPFLVRVAGDGHKMIEAMLQVSPHLNSNSTPRLTGSGTRHTQSFGRKRRRDPPVFGEERGRFFGPTARTARYLKLQCGRGRFPRASAVHRGRTWSGFVCEPVRNSDGRGGGVSVEIVHLS